MFAIIETGGKQYKVKKGDRVRVEKLAAGKNGNVVFNKVLLLQDGNDVKIGTPFVGGVAVEARVVRAGRDRKKIVFRYHSKTRYRKFKTHRQPFTEVEVIKIG